MLVCPPAGVLAVGFVERLVADDVTQRIHGHGRLVVGGNSPRCRIKRIPVAVPHRLYLVACARDIVVALPSRCPCIHLPESGIGLTRIEGCKTLVHPGKLFLVLTDDHGKPHVTDLMERHTEETLVSTGAADMCNHRKLHAASDNAFDDCHVRPRVWHGELFGEEFDRIFTKLGSARPGRRAGPVERVDQ